MANRKISELPMYNPEIGEWSDMVVTNDQRTLQRVNISDYVFKNEQEAINRIIEIYRSGSKAFIMKYKE